MFLWGNHYFYDVRRGQVVWFTGEAAPRPVDMQTEDGRYHETRPIPVPWELFWRVDAEATSRCIRAQAEGHLVDPDSGEHNRHADRRRGHAFLESGGILAETLCWLAGRADDRELVDLAERVAGFSLCHRDASTGLLSNSPTLDRWDMHTSTSEVGMWAGSLARCAEMSGRGRFQEMASEALSSWLEHAWDEETRGYYGKLRIADASPVLGPKETLYQPGDYADPWEPLFPAHDYPMPCAEACVQCYLASGDTRFATGVRRWVDVVEKSLPGREGLGGYAEHYGRCIHFLLEASEAFGQRGWRSIAERIAEEAMRALWADGRFRSHPGEDRCDAVDGLGFLVLALLRLETGREPDLMGMAF